MPRQPPRPWPLLSGTGDTGRRIAHLLCAVLLFACLAPGISARLHVARSAAADSASDATASAPVAHAGHGAADPCSDHRDHGAAAGCAESAEHANHGVYCGFCVLFSLLPVLPGVRLATGTAVPPRTAARSAGPREQPDVGDAVSAWLQQRQHGPPPRG